MFNEPQFTINIIEGGLNMGSTGTKDSGTRFQFNPEKAGVTF